MPKGIVGPKSGSPKAGIQDAHSAMVVMAKGLDEIRLRGEENLVAPLEVWQHRVGGGGSFKARAKKTGLLLGMPSCSFAVAE